jgi:hypothetical protein
MSRTDNIRVGARAEIATASRDYFDFVNVQSNRVEVIDIAVGLSNCCRYAGQVSRMTHDGPVPIFYSVAQHSVMVADMVRWLGGGVAEQLQGLVHDAAEAFIHDVTGPLKKLLPEYRVIEERVHNDLMRRLRVNPVLTPRVKQADVLALAVEKRWLWQNYDEWQILQGADIAGAVETFEISNCWGNELACRNWMRHYKRLTNRIAESATCLS